VEELTFPHVHIEGMELAGEEPEFDFGHRLNTQQRVLNRGLLPGCTADSMAVTNVTFPKLPDRSLLVHTILCRGPKTGP
jgi:hypothetical protein